MPAISLLIATELKGLSIAGFFLPHAIYIFTNHSWVLLGVALRGMKCWR